MLCPPIPLPAIFSLTGLLGPGAASHTHIHTHTCQPAWQYLAWLASEQCCWAGSRATGNAKWLPGGPAGRSPRHGAARPPGCPALSQQQTGKTLLPRGLVHSLPCFSPRLQKTPPGEAALGTQGLGQLCPAGRRFSGH